MLTSIIILILGMIALIVSADKLVDGASAMAKNFGVAPLVIGMTIIAFGSSAPEVVVSGMAALNGMGDTAIGNVLGSNIANIGLILGITAIVVPIKISKGTVSEVPFFLFSTFVGVCALVFSESINIIEGIVLIATLLLFLKIQYKKGMAVSNVEDEQDIAEMSNAKAFLFIIIGLVGLPIASNYIVESSVVIAKFFGMSDLVIGLTIIAVGTSLPELAASVASVRKKQFDMAIGNVIGSNIFNILAVLSVPAFMSNAAVDELAIMRDTPAMVVFSLLLVAFCHSKGKSITRPFGVLLVLLYCGYQALVLSSVG
ncbi:calcium/sodium antiporter [Vibrio sp. D431a]|uniref:calcium/sodium antiporter n=1 Tax=Vibrio sp. D431a TaxID=2837388 RepID=UPI002552C401|nr:calcium/sodium antiporter [Vibrio sp. D431a]MDK9790733.1 calcium/sodium antiporter [Vibrio sp. D431a]